MRVHVAQSTPYVHSGEPISSKPIVRRFLKPVVPHDVVVSSSWKLHSPPFTGGTCDNDFVWLTGALLLCLLAAKEGLGL